MPNQAHILVIDDEQIMREGCSRILSKDGLAVVTAENGKQGLEEIQGHPETIDVILLDLMMPGMSGMEVLDQIRAIDPNLLVIVITGYATVESAVEAMKKGAYDFIPKPFTPDQLRIVVKRALERRTLQKEAEFLRKEREKSLRDIATEKSKIKTIINCMGDGVLVCDRDSCIVLSNPAASRMLKVHESSLIGNFLPQCNLHTELSNLIQESLTTKDKGYTSVSQELSMGDSGEIFLRAHTAPVRNDLGETLGSVTVLQDISHLKELDKMKSEFIAMVAHELRAPLAAVEQQLTVILNKMAGEITEKQEQLLGRAKERTKGLLTLIKDLLDLSKIEAGMMVQYKEPLRLQEVVQKVVDLMRAEAEAKKLDLQFTAPHTLPLINADRNSMEGIFTNLISNAIKYTPEGGKVWVDLVEEGEFVKATVSDTGIGIKKEDLPRIFDKFYRVKTVETRQIVGTGLGLSIVKSVVDAHLGFISVESEEGGGTTFTVLLPKGPIQTA
ncbi:MAG: response regulator [Syntrophaceae bacterium]|nr:response regulator [Syntrophaceae bacterium]